MLKSLRSLQSIRSLESLRSLEDIKIRPSTMLLGLGGILLVAYVVIGGAYIKEQREQSSLREQIAAGGGTLSGVGNSQQTLKGLEEQLAEVKGNLDSLENAFPTELDSTAIVESLLGYANQSHILIKQMSTLPPSEVKVQEEGAASYTVLRYSLVVEGGLPDMLAFVSLVEGGAAQTAAIGDIGLAEAEGKQEMTLGVSFYARSESKESAGAAGTDGAPAPTPSTPGTIPQSPTEGNGP